MTERAVLEGSLSVEAALEAESRPLDRILVRRERATDTPRLRRLARERGVPLERVPESMIEEHALGRSHGGVIALAGARRFLPLEELAATRPDAVLVMLDGVEDPYNFASAVRSLYAAGVDGLVVRPRNWLSAAGTVARASAGASELMPSAVAEDPAAAAGILRRRGFRVACAALGSDSVSVFEAPLEGPLFLLIGGERRGITRSFRDRADLRLHIPYGRPEAAALGAAAAAAVIGFEIGRRRTAAPTEEPPS